MFNKTCLFISIICLCNSFFSHAQTHTIDSLKHQVQIAGNNDQKLQAIFALCDKRHSLSTDTLYYYTRIAQSLSKAANSNHDIILSDYYYIYCLIKKGNTDSALKICEKYISELANNAKEREVYMHFIGTKAGLLIKLNRYKESYSTFYNLLVESEKNNDTLNELGAYNGLGWVNMEMDNNNEALRFLKIALQNSAINNIEKYGDYYAFIYSNIASAYNSLNQNDSAEYFINKAIPLARQFENLTSFANALAIKADILSATKRSKEAEQALIQVVNIRKQIGDPYFVVSDMSQLAIYYYHNNQPQKGIAAAQEGIYLASKNNLTAKLPLLYEALAQNYDTAGDYKMCAETLKKIINLKDSLYAKNSADALAEIRGKYEVQKNENTIAQQKLRIIKSNNLLYGTIAFFIFSLSLSYVFFTGYRKRQTLKAKLLLEEEKRQTEIAVIDAAEKERKRIAADLHDNMGAYATAIIANVDDLMANKNAASGPTLISLKGNAAELMSNLRDTIWASNKERIFLTDISDRFKIYIRKINRAYPLINIEINETIVNNISFSPVQALDIFRILQEACTNSLKHSFADLISIQFNNDSDNTLRICIADNGTGITNDHYEQSGNGIKNMKQRAEEAGLIFSIRKNQPTGLTIVLTSEMILHI